MKWCASGTWSHDHPPPGYDYYVLKTATLYPREPRNPSIRRVGDGAYVNSIGVVNPGIATLLASLPTVPGNLVVSILAEWHEDWRTLAAACEEADVATIELNLSCPNLDAKSLVGEEPRETSWAVNDARDAFTGTLVAKVPPAVPTNIYTTIANAGADKLHISNTLRTPLGGLSGTPLRTLTLDGVRRAKRAVDIPVIAGGGVGCGDNSYGTYEVNGADELSVGTFLLMQGYKPEGLPV